MLLVFNSGSLMLGTHWSTSGYVWHFPAVGLEPQLRFELPNGQVLEPASRWMCLHMEMELPVLEFGKWLVHVPSGGGQSLGTRTKPLGVIATLGTSGFPCAGGLEAAVDVGPGSVQAALSPLSVIYLAQVKHQASWIALGMQENKVEYSSLQSINLLRFS